MSTFRGPSALVDLASGVLGIPKAEAARMILAPKSPLIAEY